MVVGNEDVAPPKCGEVCGNMRVGTTGDDLEKNYNFAHLPIDFVKIA